MHEITLYVQYNTGTRNGSFMETFFFLRSFLLTAFTLPNILMSIFEFVAYAINATQIKTKTKTKTKRKNVAEKTKFLLQSMVYTDAIMIIISLTYGWLKVMII